MNKTAKSFLCLVALSTSMLQAQQVWNLQDCLNYASEHNLQIKQSRNALESAESDVKKSHADLFPSLTFSSQQTLGFQKVESQSYGSLDSKPKNPTYSGSYGLRGSVVLYNGGANWRTLRQSEVQQQAQSLTVEQTLQEIQRNIIQAYYQVLYAHESVLTNEEIVKVSERELERTQALKEVGRSSQVEVAQMESQLQSNRYQLTQAQITESENLLSLQQILQLAPGTDFQVDIHNYSDDEVLALIPSLADAMAMAENYTPDMRIAELNVKSQEMQVKIAQGGYQPTVSLDAGLQTGNGNTLPGSFGTQISDHLQASVGLSLSVPIFDNRKNKTSVEKARIQLANTELEQANTLLSLQNTIAGLHLDIESAQSRYRSAVAAEESSRQSFEMMEERYGVGLEALIDLLTEKNNYLKAKQETLQSKYTALLNQELLYSYIGKNK